MGMPATTVTDVVITAVLVLVDVWGLKCLPTAGGFPDENPANNNNNKAKASKLRFSGRSGRCVWEFIFSNHAGRRARKFRFSSRAGRRNKIKI